MSPDSVCWSLSGTEKKYFSGRSLAIDGMNNVIEFLDKLESGQLAHIDFWKCVLVIRVVPVASFVPVTDFLRWNDSNNVRKNWKIETPK